MIYIASDHVGLQLKQTLLAQLETVLKLPVTDLGPVTYQETDDFPDFAAPLAKKVVANAENRGILICGSGHGMCIAANKIKGVRAIVGYSIEGAELGRRHNDANIVCLAARVISNDHALAIVKKFLTTNFESAERLVRRNQKIAAIEAE